MAGSRESDWLNARRADGRRARDTMTMMMIRISSVVLNRRLHTLRRIKSALLSGSDLGIVTKFCNFHLIWYAILQKIIWN